MTAKLPIFREEALEFRADRRRRDAGIRLNDRRLAVYFWGNVSWLLGSLIAGYTIPVSVEAATLHGYWDQRKQVAIAAVPSNLARFAKPGMSLEVRSRHLVFPFRVEAQYKNVHEWSDSPLEGPLLQELHRALGEPTQCSIPEQPVEVGCRAIVAVPERGVEMSDNFASREVIIVLTDRKPLLSHLFPYRWWSLL